MLQEIVQMLEIKSIDTAMNGHDGFLKVVKKQYDFVICDLNMPVVDGFECAQKITNHYSSPTLFVEQDLSAFQPLLIACSAHVDNEITRKAKHHGFEMVYQILTIEVLKDQILVRVLER